MKVTTTTQYHTAKSYRHALFTHWEYLTPIERMAALFTLKEYESHERNLHN